MGDQLFSISLAGNISILDVDNPERPKKVIRGHNKLITCLAYDKARSNKNILLGIKKAYNIWRSLGWSQAIQW